jgi:predicted metalloprotease with PDZ domain
VASANLVTVAILFLLISVDAAAATDHLRYTIRYDPFEVELTLPDGAKQKKSLPRQADYFFHRVNMRWPVPEGPADKPVRCEFLWIGFPSDWRVVSSWSIDRREEVVDTTLRGLRKAVFAGGNLRTAKSKGGLVVVTRGQWPLSDTSLLNLVDRIAASHTAVWRDRGVAGHKIFLLPTTRTWEGEGRTQSLIMEGNPDTWDAPFLQRLLSHELFHEWNPRRLNYTDDEELYWFTEGFTDYYTVARLWHSGVWSFDDVIADFNRVARRYYVSPARNLTASQMVARRQSNVSANQLPYQQGYLLAADWNRRGKGLDAAMRALLKSNREPLSNARIARAVHSIGIKTPDNDIQRFVVEGKTIELQTDIWAPVQRKSRHHFAPSTLASTGLPRSRQRSSRVRSPTAMPGEQVFGTVRSGLLLTLDSATRPISPKLRLKTDKEPVGSSFIQHRVMRYRLLSIRPARANAILPRSPHFPNEYPRVGMTIPRKSRC